MDLSVDSICMSLNDYSHTFKFNGNHSDQELDQSLNIDGSIRMNTVEQLHRWIRCQNHCR